MNPLHIIEKYYPEDNDQRRLLILHSQMVAEEALRIANNLDTKIVDRNFIQEAAMLHDIGIFRCNAPSIYCYGPLPYIEHGVEGAEILRGEGYVRHALVCERHTGSGITAKEIIERNMPLPRRDLLPESIEEKIICVADKFYSKSRTPRRRKTLEEIENSLAKFGPDALLRWHSLIEELNVTE
ncbi:MAG: HD domain-containing protein [Muribaculum sp.]|nr:HD domain-containing protein [Muribaculum sp.]